MKTLLTTQLYERNSLLRFSSKSSYGHSGASKATMVNYDFKLEDEKHMRFVRVQAKNATEALLKAIKKSNILNPSNVFQKQENGEFKVFNF